jgi:hypothetical protein
MSFVSDDFLVVQLTVLAYISLAELARVLLAVVGPFKVAKNVIMSANTGRTVVAGRLRLELWTCRSFLLS